MKVSRGGGGAVAESPLGQHLVKVIGSVCFSLFVVAVLIFTVIAVSYQPSDPWFDSSKAIVDRSFSQTLPYATFREDDTVIPTGEDDGSSASTPEAVGGSTFAGIVPTDVTCNSVDGSVPINCSHPAVLAAIQRFNARIFKSLVFIAYETPVAGSMPDRCDAAWSFRNRKEKSKRKYRDYRWFRLAAGDNCTFQVLAAGKFRTGTKASRREWGSKGAPPAGLSFRSPAAPSRTADSDINDTIPILGSESDFREGRYLYYSRGGDHCKGMNHYMWSFLCALGEAIFLNRTFVMDLSMCLSAAYNPSAKDEEGKDFRFYFDFEHLKESASVVEEGEFLRSWKNWERAPVDSKKRLPAITVKKVPTYKTTPMKLKKDTSTILWKRFDNL